jgi:hypothetical protein
VYVCICIYLRMYTYVYYLDIIQTGLSVSSEKLLDIQVSYSDALLPNFSSGAVPIPPPLSLSLSLSLSVRELSFTNHSTSLMVRLPF